MCLKFKQKVFGKRIYPMPTHSKVILTGTYSILSLVALGMYVFYLLVFMLGLVLFCILS